jgi:hypothetical protein
MKPASQKLQVYETLHTLNDGLEKVGFRRELLTEFRVVVEENRAWANFELTEAMHEREERDWVSFGRLRHQWEKKRRDPNDVLIEAERLKLKLRKAAKQRAAKRQHLKKNIRKRTG